MHSQVFQTDLFRFCRLLFTNVIFAIYCKFLLSEKLLNVCDNNYEKIKAIVYKYFVRGPDRYRLCTCHITGALSLIEDRESSDPTFPFTDVRVDGQQIKQVSPKGGGSSCYRKKSLKNKSQTVQLVLNGSFDPKRLWLLKGIQ